MASDGQNPDNGKTGENGRNKTGSESGANGRLEAILTRYLQYLANKRLSDAQRDMDTMWLEVYVRFKCFHSATALTTLAAKGRGNTGFLLI